MLSAEHTSRFLVPLLRWLDPQISFAAIASVHAVVRKVGHFVEYAVLAALLWRALHTMLESARIIAIAEIAIAVSTLFAISDEFHQSFIASRTASADDVAVDICGALFALAVCALLATRRRPAAKL